jgi:small conductance mechanosensitive channel
VDIGISYDSNIDKAIAIIKDEARKHPLFVDNRGIDEVAKDIHPVTVRTVSLGDFSVNFKAYVWSNNNDNAFILKCDLLKSVKERFDKEGIEIPFPYRTIVYKKDLNEHQKEKNT